MYQTLPSLPEQLRSASLRYRPTPLGRQMCPRAPRVASRWWYLGSRAPRASSILGESGGTDRQMHRVEAVLFLAREPLSSRKISQHANLADGTQARTLVGRLNRHYDRMGRAFRVEEVAGGFQMLTREKFASWLRRPGHVPSEVRFSAPAMETLAVVVYRQPVLRAEIEAVRGVACGEILRLLMERDLVRISGRSEELGRPYLYSTTRRFLQLFGLRSLEELPEVDALTELSKTHDTSSAQADGEETIEDGPIRTTDSLEQREPDVSVTTISKNEGDVTHQPPSGAAPEVVADLSGDRELDREDDLDFDDDLDDDDDDDDLDDDDDDLLDDEWEEVDDEDFDDEDDEDDDDEDDLDWDDDDDEEDDVVVDDID